MSTEILFANNAKTTLASGILSTDLTIPLAVGTGSRFSSPGANQHFFITLVNAASEREICKCTGRTADSLTVVRAQEGTTARAYSTGDIVSARVTKGVLEKFPQTDKDNVHNGKNTFNSAVTMLSGINYGGVSTGGADAQVVALDPAPSGAIAVGTLLFFRAGYSNTSSTPSLAVTGDTDGAKTLIKSDGQPLAAGDILANAEIVVIKSLIGATKYWSVLNVSTGSGGGTSSPNLIRNGSFEGSVAGGVPDGWSVNIYSGGTVSVVDSPVTQGHAKKALSIASTNLSAGGGQATTDFIPVMSNEVYQVKCWGGASVPGMSVRIEALWYNATQGAPISTQTLYESVAGTPTQATLLSGTITAPNAARYCKLRATGGIPGLGTQVGTAYIDACFMFEQPTYGSVGQLQLANSSVGRAQAKTSVANHSLPVLINNFGWITLAGGSDSWSMYHAYQSGGDPLPTAMGSGPGGLGTVTFGYVNWTGIASPPASMTVYVKERYFSASPPYDLGDGEIPLFTYALIEQHTGKVLATYSAEDPPWAYRGPNNITPDFVDPSTGKKYKRKLILPKRFNEVKTPEEMDAYHDALHHSSFDLVEIDQSLKQADMPLFPHPFMGQDLKGKIVVLLNPMGGFCECLQRMQSEADENISDLIHSGDIIITNNTVSAKAPPGVMCVEAKFKHTRGK